MVSGVKRKLEDRDWERYGPIEPVGVEEWGGPGWSNWRNSSLNNHSSLTGTPPSSGSLQMPSLAESEGSEGSSGYQEGSSGGSIASLLRQSFQQAVSGSAQVVGSYIDDQLLSLRLNSDDSEQAVAESDWNTSNGVAGDDSDLLNEE